MDDSGQMTEVVIGVQKVSSHRANRGLVGEAYAPTGDVECNADAAAIAEQVATGVLAVLPKNGRS